MSTPNDRQPALRIIDANLNRAREALRVMEDYARFILDDPALSESIKRVRHHLPEAIPAQLAEQLPRSRDILGDVGRDTKTQSETSRADAHAVAIAAGKRLGESLRVIEEYGKTIDPAFATKIEQLRYQGYELERRLLITSQARERFAHVRLYVIITESLCCGDWFTTAEAVIRGGADCIQLREKQVPERDLLDRAKHLTALCHQHGTLCIINDRPDIAALSGADGVHLGQHDLPIASARRVLPPSAIVGISTHTIDQVRRAVEQAPDYIAVGPMFPSTTKPQEHIAGPSTLASAISITGVPLVAIGGITAQNVQTVLAAAPCTICVCGSVIAQPNPTEACRRILNQFPDSHAAVL